MGPHYAVVAVLQITQWKESTLYCRITEASTHVHWHYYGYYGRSVVYFWLPRDHPEQSIHWYILAFFNWSQVCESDVWLSSIVKFYLIISAIFGLCQYCLDGFKDDISLFMSREMSTLFLICIERRLRTFLICRKKHTASAVAGLVMLHHSFKSFCLS